MQGVKPDELSKGVHVQKKVGDGLKLLNTHAASMKWRWNFGFASNMSFPSFSVLSL